MTWKEVLIRLYGIDKRRIEEKRNIRDLAYTVHIHAVESKHRLNIFEFMPLPGDPSKQELKEYEAERQKKFEDEMMIIYEKAQLLMNPVKA